AGTSATVDFIADLVPGRGERRERLVTAMAAVQSHEDRLFARLTYGLERLDGVTVHGRPERRTPTVLFTVRDRSPQAVHERLAERDVNAPAGSFYAIEAARRLGLGDIGAVRAGLAPYTDDEDVDRLLAGVTELCG
ncbi:MAG: aminotransferase class V-fold PLP-dependent enzyme, partial [Nocardioidaceae bacterium]